MNDLDKKEMVAAITATIREVVNGKIDRIDAKMDLHIENTELFRVAMAEKMGALDPVIEGMATIKNGRSFLMWIGAPLAVIGALVAFFK